MPPLAVIVAISPLQIITLCGLIEAIGKVFTSTVFMAEAVQPLSSVTVTWNAVVELGFTEIDADDSPVFQINELPPLAVNIALSPWQKAMVAGDIAVTGNAFTVNVRDRISEHPFPSNTVT